MLNFRSRKFLLLLYISDTTEKIIEYIKLNYDYIYINHNKDLKNDDTEKKEHIHLVLFCKNAKWNTALSTELGIDIRFIQKINNDDCILMYLLHKDKLEKYQYDIRELKGTPKIIKKVENLLKNRDNTESEKVVELLDFIHNSGPLLIKDFAFYCASIDNWDIFRRSALIFIKIIEEHNLLVDKHRKL